MNEVKELIGLSNKNIKVTDVKEVIKNKQIIKEITIVGNIKKVKCPVCNKYTSSIHDYLKPMSIKYNKMACYDCNLILIKRGFICHRCNKKIVEDLEINGYKRNISNGLEIKIRKDLLKYYLSTTLY